MKNLSINRILIFSVIFSFAWHICWLAVIKVVAAPVAAPVKFSKVLFLGPILVKASGIQVQQRESSFLERRYLDLAERAAYQKSVVGQDAYCKYGRLGEEGRIVNEEKLIGHIDDAVSGQKLEPIHYLD